jgi:hypothetical protein
VEEVRKKCEALKRRPRRKFLLLVRVCGPLVTTNLFQCKWGTLFERLGVCKCVLFALKEVLEHEQGVQKFDGPQKKKKKQNAFGVQHTNWYKRVSSVTRSSRYRSIYIDWQRSYDE